MYIKNNYSLFALPPQQGVGGRGGGGGVEGGFLTRPPRQERTHILFQRGPLLQIWAVGVERGIYGGYWLCLSSFTLEILVCNCVKANSCEKFEAKISEKSEKKESEYLKRTSESHVKRISVRLLFALKRKNFLSETGAPYLQTDRRKGSLLPVQLLCKQTGGKGNCYQCNCSVNRQEGRVIVISATAL